MSSMHRPSLAPLLAKRRLETTVRCFCGLAMLSLLTAAYFGQPSAPALRTEARQARENGSEATRVIEQGPEAAERLPERSHTDGARIFSARGILRKIRDDGRTVEIQHEAITNYMPAMTMPFKIASAEVLAGLREGDEISFRLLVSDYESWIDKIRKTGQEHLAPARVSDKNVQASRPDASRHPLLDYKFTNQLGQPVSLAQFQGQALAITFFFTRCPIPDFCPRLSKNFEQASRKLAHLPNAPTNWHFISVSFDTEFDTPAVLKTYAEHYHYEPNHWSFLTGASDKIAELARLSDVTTTREGSLFNHNFRTLIIDPAGHLQMAFPIGGNLADAIAEQILKAAAVTSQSVSRDASQVMAAAGHDAAVVEREDARDGGVERPRQTSAKP